MWLIGAVGKAFVEGTERRTSIDTARFLKQLSDDVYATATRIVLVMGNLSTHTMACLYEAYPPAEARRIARRFEIHYTWLRSRKGGKVKWHFRAEDARIKLHRLYPSLP